LSMSRRRRSMGPGRLKSSWRSVISQNRGCRVFSNVASAQPANCRSCRAPRRAALIERR
jgi:hypothetical protein